ncbi:hypothetical protein STAL104432_05010 [Streptomyces albus]
MSGLRLSTTGSVRRPASHVDRVGWAGWTVTSPGACGLRRSAVMPAQSGYARVGWPFLAENGLSTSSL